MDFAVPADHRVKLKEIEKKDKYLDHARELKETIEHEHDGDTNYNWHAWCSNQRIRTGIGGRGNLRKSGNHPNYIIIEISLNTKKSPWDFRRLAVI